MSSLLVEVDLALSRPPGAHATVWISVAIETRWEHAVETACQMAASTRDVVMPTGYRVIDWTE